MTQPQVTITHSLINAGVPVVIDCSKVITGNKRNINANPNANVSGPVEVQGKAVENRRLSLPNVHFNTNDLHVTAEEMEDLLQLDYDGTNAPILNVVYGGSISKNYFQNSGDVVFDALVDGYVARHTVTIGAAAATNYTVNVYVNGALYASRSGTTVLPNEKVVVNFLESDYTLFADRGDEITVEVDGPTNGNATASYTNTQQTLKSMSGLSDIPVILEAYSYPIDVADSKEGYMPVGSMTFIETTTNTL